MDRMTGRARFLGRATALGAATFAALLAAGAVGVADAAQAATPTVAAHVTANGFSESFGLPAGVASVKIGTGHTQVTVARAAGVSPQDYIGCNLSVSNPAYNGSGVSSTAVIRCAYPTGIYLETGISYNGGTPVAVGHSFPSTYVASLTVTTSATPGYYQSYAVAILDDGQQYGYDYSSKVYIPQ